LDIYLSNREIKMTRKHTKALRRSKAIKKQQNIL